MIRFVSILLIALIGCKKSSERPCWKSAGKTVSEIRILPNSNTINIFDDVNINLIQDSLNFIEIKSYENLISFIEIISIDTATEIRNVNKCNSLRKKEITNTINIHFNNIKTLNLYGTGEINFIDTIKQYYLEVNSYESRSTLNLTINCHQLQCAFIEGSFIANIAGNSDSTYIFQSKYSIVKASELTNSYLHFSNNSTGNAYVQATNKLLVELLDVGNIFYKGKPTIVISRDIGLGNIISQ